MTEPSIEDAFVRESIVLLRESLLPRARTALARLSDDEVWWRPNEHSNSVGNMLLHLCGNIRQWIISGVGGMPDTRTRPLEFSEEGPIPASELLARLEDTVEEAVAVLERLDRSRLLEERRIQAYDASLLRAIFHVVEHFSYHTGQIVYVVKMLRDEDLRFYNL